MTIEVSDSTSPIPQSVSRQVTLEFAQAGPLAVDGEQLGSCTVGQLCSDPLSAEGGIGPYTWALASGSVPVGLELDASGNLTGTPLEAGTFSFSAQATDSSTPNPASANGAFTIDVAPAAPLSVTAPTLPTTTQGQWYDDYDAFPVSGGISPYTLSVVSGALPSGLEMDSYGDLYGTPTAAGAFAFVVGATDSADPIPDVATVSVTFVVAPAPRLAISTTSLSSGSVGEEYDAELDASGGIPSYTWSVVSGSVPNGLTFESWGELLGVPTKEGSFTFGIGLSDSATPAASVSETFTVVIGPSQPLAITTPGVSTGVQGSSYETTLVATGGTAPYTWSVTSGSLPEGVGVASYGDIFGIPETSGTFTFTATATDAASPTPDAVSGQVTLVIAPPPSLAIVTTGLPAAIQGQEYEDEIQATGGVGAFTWSISSGALPAGMQLDSDGTLEGYPATSGTFGVTLEVTDGNWPTPDVARESVQLVVESGSSLSVSSYPLGEATEGQYYDDDGFYATGGDGPYTWSVVSGELPPGIVVDSTGDLLGEPLQSGVFTFELEVTDSGSPTPSTSEEPGVLVVEPAAPLSTQGADLSATQGQYSYEEFQAEGGAGPYTWSVQAGVVPPGLTLDPEGYLTGVPSTAGTYQFSVEVTDSAVPSPSEASGVVTVTVGPAPTLEVVTPVLQPATEGAAYGDFLSASGGVGSDAWSVSSGTLPSGLSLDGSGYLSGIPLVQGTFTFVVDATDSASPSPHVASATVSITIAPAALLATDGLAPASIVEGQTFVGDLNATGGIGPYTWSLLSGTLPTGIALDASGELTGAPTVSGTFTFDAQVTDAASPVPDVASEQVSLTVAPASVLTAAVEGALETGNEGTSYFSSVPVQVFGGFVPYTWSIASGELPPGLSFDSAQLALEGVPTQPGTYNFGLKITDSSVPSPETADVLLSVTIEPEAPFKVQSVVLPAATQGGEYYQSLQSDASGGVAPYTWGVTAGSLPPGVSLDAQGVIQGVPSTAGTFAFTATVTDSAQPEPNPASLEESITVRPPVPFALTTSSVPAARVDQPYQTQLTASGGELPYTWSLGSGSLPSGLEFSDEGVLSGTPTKYGTFSFVVTVQDGNDETPPIATNLSLVVAPPLLTDRRIHAADRTTRRTVFREH